MTTPPTEPSAPAPSEGPTGEGPVSAGMTAQEAKARAAATKQGPIGIGVAAVAGVALMARYLFWPMDGVPPYVTGGLIGLVVAGLSIERQRRKTLDRPWMPGTSLIVAVGLGVVSIGIGWFRADLLALIDGFETRERTLPGFTMALPPWEVEELDLNPRSGEIKLAAPTGNGRFIRSVWNVSDPAAVDQLSTMLVGSGAEIVAQTAIEVGGHEGTRFAIAYAGGKRARIAHWYCPEHQRAHQVWTFLSVGDATLDDIAATLEDGVWCHEPIEGGMPPPKMPEATAPDGWGVDKRVESTVFTSPDDTLALTLFAMLPDAKIAPTLKDAPELRLNVLRGLVMGTAVTLDDSVGALLGKGAPITVFRGTAGEGEEQEQLLFAAYACHGPDGTVVALASAPMGASTTPLEELLQTATCPEQR
jgi:hypothetical protein